MCAWMVLMCLRKLGVRAGEEGGEESYIPNTDFNPKAERRLEKNQHLNFSFDQTLIKQRDETEACQWSGEPENQ